MIFVFFLYEDSGMASVAYFVVVLVLNGHRNILVKVMFHVVVYLNQRHLVLSILLNVEVEQQLALLVHLNHRQQQQMNFLLITIGNIDKIN